MFRTIKVLVVFLVVLFVCLRATSEAPDSTFKKATGRMYCEANPGHPACRGHNTLTITLDPGKTIDRSYNQGSVPCCGGEENGNGASTVIPAGVYVEFAGGHDGEWGIFNVKLVADSSNVDDNGVVRAWTIEADTYCGPSGAVGKGGCNVNGYAWVKQK